jgi:polar amino acid transport system substrate-binding protein
MSHLGKTQDSSQNIAYQQALSKRKNIFCLLACWLAYVLASLPVNASTSARVTQTVMPDKFVFGTNTEDTVFTGLWERLIYREAFKRAGVRLEVVVAPLKRIEMMLDRGEIDGEMVRAPAYGQQHPNLILIDVPIMQVIFSIYALKPVAGLNSLEDLRKTPFSGAYTRGVIFCENTLSSLMPAHKLTMVSSVKQGIDMLAAGHVDFFCDVSSSLWNYDYAYANKSMPKLKKLFDISKQVANTAYLHPKYKEFAGKLTSVLKQMEKEGLIEKYRLDAVAQLSQRSEK